MHTDFMDSLFFDSNVKLTDLNKGLTNQNFLMEINQDAYVLRVPRQDAEQIVNRHHETLALEAIKDSGIDVEMIYYDEISGYKVTRYLPDALTYQECNAPDKIETVAKLMKRFHGLQANIQEAFDPMARLHNYQVNITKPLLDLSAFSWIEDSISHLHNPQVLCHNDWVDGNILFSKNQVYLIDYEYAADNDPLFDVMSFLSENQITCPALRKRFYDAYFETYDEQTLLQLSLWEDFHNYLWCHWAMMMYESRQEAIYHDIAIDKFQALCQKKNLM